MKMFLLGNSSKFFMGKPLAINIIVCDQKTPKSPIRMNEEEMLSLYYFPDVHLVSDYQ